MKHANLVAALTGAGIAVESHYLDHQQFTARNGQKEIEWFSLPDGKIFQIYKQFYDPRWDLFCTMNSIEVSARVPKSIKEAVAWLTDYDPAKNYVLDILTSERNLLSARLNKAEDVLQQELGWIYKGYFFSGERSGKLADLSEEISKLLDKCYKLMAEQNAEDRKK